MNNMKKILFAIAALALAACAPGTEESLQSGDLVFVGIPAGYGLDERAMDGAISGATSDGSALNFIHAAILEIDPEGRAWIIDATVRRGVDRHPLDTFLRDFALRDGSAPVFEVMRLKDDSRAAECVQNAKRYLGRPYDLHFAPDDSALYCTELIYDSYLAPDGTPLFSAAPMNFRNADGEFPLYWQQLFERLGEPIPQDVPGTNPQAMTKEPALRRVNLDLGTVR